MKPYAEIKRLIENGQSTGCAEPTGRVLPEDHLQATCQEWKEVIRVDGHEYAVYYIIANADVEGEDLTLAPWAESISRICLIDEDCEIDLEDQ